MVSIYKIAEHLDLYLSNYIDCLGDLALILLILPAQVYRPVLEKLDENIATKKITTVFMKKNDKMKVIMKPSPVEERDSLYDTNKVQEDTEEST